MPFRTFVGFVETIELNLINSHKNNKVSCKGIVSELLIFSNNPLVSEKAEIFSEIQESNVGYLTPPDGPSHGSKLELLKKVIAT